MLDIIIIFATVVISKRISDIHSSSSSASSTRHIFQLTLIISFLLFALSILEAAPAACLTIVSMADPLSNDYTPRSAVTFVTSYRILLWVLCILLLVLHPIYLCASIGSSLLGVLGVGIGITQRIVAQLSSTSALALYDRSSYRRRRTNSGASSSTSILPLSSSPSSSSPLARGFNQNPKQSKALRLLQLCWNIIWIGIRFTIVTICWQLILRRIIRRVIPYQILITRREYHLPHGNTAETTSGHWCCRRMTPSMSVTTLFVFMAAIVIMMVLLLAPQSSFFLRHFQAATSYLSDYLSIMVSTLCTIGMIIASILNGFGCASLPHANLVGILLQPTPKEVICKMELELDYATKTLDKTKQCWLLLVDDNNHDDNAKSKSNQQQQQQLHDKYIFLTNLVEDMNDDIHEMKSSNVLAMQARTIFGRVRGILGVVFSIVLVVRVLLASTSFLSSTSSLVPKVDSSGHLMRDNNDDGDANDPSSHDSLTNLLLLLVGRNYMINNAAQYDQIRQMISLILAGILTISQINSFFRLVGALERKLRGTFLLGGGIRTTNSLYKSSVEQQHQQSQQQSSDKSYQRGKNEVAILISSFVMGCYFLACVTVVKMSLPNEYRLSFLTALGVRSNFTYGGSATHNQLFNKIFFVSSLISAIILASLFGIQRTNSNRYQVECNHYLSSNFSSSSSSLMSLA